MTYKNPVGIITKNSMIMRDLDIIKQLVNDQLFTAYFSMNSLDESIRRKLEPRTATAKQKLKAIEALSKVGTEGRFDDWSCHTWLK